MSVHPLKQSSDILYPTNLLSFINSMDGLLPVFPPELEDDPPPPELPPPTFPPPIPEPCDMMLESQKSV